MSESLWNSSVHDLLTATASSAPTPGGGSVASVCGAFGIGLMQMAVAVTADDALAERAERLVALRSTVESAADGDVADFTVLMAAYGLPRKTDEERAARDRAIETASIAATERPLSLVAALVEAVNESRELESLVKPGIVSDVLAGRDLALGAARAAVRTADINIDQLERLGSTAAPQLREQRDSLVAQIGGEA